MLNKACIQGRLVTDIDMKYTQSNTAVASFRIANDVGFGDKKQTNFISCVAWGKTAENIGKFFGKGDMVIIDGHIQTRDYEKDGQKRYITEIVVEGFNFAGGKKELQSDENGYYPGGAI